MEPTEAACESLEESVEDLFADMKRRLELGLETAAEAICRGIVIGLHRARKRGSDGLLGWVVDFPEETACRAVGELLRACPPAVRDAVRDRIVAALAVDVPDWSEMIARAADRAVAEMHT